MRCIDPLQRRVVVCRIAPAVYFHKLALLGKIDPAVGTELSLGSAQGDLPRLPNLHLPHAASRCTADLHLG